MKKSILICAALMIINACSRSTDGHTTVTLREKIEIDFDARLFNAIPLQYELNAVGEILAFDGSQEEFQVFSLNGNEKPYKIPVNFAGPEGIPLPVFSAILHDEVCYISTANSLCAIDKEGKKVKEVLFKDILREMSIPDTASLSIIPRSNWDRQNGDVYLWLKPHNSHASKFEVYNKKISLIRYSLKENKGEVLDLPVPEDLIQEGFKGYYFNIVPHLSVQNGMIIYAFSPLPEVYIHHSITGETTILDVKPEIYNRETPIEYRNYGRRDVKKSGKATRFLDLEYDPQNQVIYRLHSQYLDGKEIGPRVLAVIDLEGRSEEFLLEENSGARILTHNGGIFSLQFDVPDEEALRINHYSIMKKPFGG